MPSLPFRWFNPLASLPLPGPSRPPSPLPLFDYQDSSEFATHTSESTITGDSASASSQSHSGSSLDEINPNYLASSFPIRSKKPSLRLSARPSAVNLLSLPRSTPNHSRPSSPLPLYTSTSEDDEVSSPFLRSRRKWGRRKRMDVTNVRGWKRTFKRIMKHPLFPTQPLTILLTLLLLTSFALLVTLSLIYILNPDKWALPWRAYCASPNADFPPPSLSVDFETLPAAGLFLGVFSMDAAVERRMLVRTSWASHVRSRGMDAATDRTVVRFILGKPRPEWERRIELEMSVYNDMIILPVTENMNNGKTHAFFTWAHENALVPPVRTNFTVNPVHRLPAPPHVPAPAPPSLPSGEEDKTDKELPTGDKETESTDGKGTEDKTEPKLPDAETDIPTPEPKLPQEETNLPKDVYVYGSNFRTGPAPSLQALHDPRPIQPVARSPAHRKRGVGLGHTKRAEGAAGEREEWVSPDFVIKADDDSFVMLAELEARLRVELALALREGIVDPMIFWGYLVKSRFMAGELYALSASLVKYIATSPKLLTMTRGAEDKQTSKWIRLHPRASEIRWRSEHCWMYDHPRSGTVYGHGFLFPSERSRVVGEVANWRNTSEAVETGDWAPETWRAGPPDVTTPLPPASDFLSRSSVSKFGKRFGYGFSNMTLGTQVEALVEGSEVSKVLSADEPRWDDLVAAIPKQETYEERYTYRPPLATDLPPSPVPVRQDAGPGFGPRGIGIGGTVVVHFIKRNEWFLEAAMALLGPSGNGDMGRIDSGTARKEVSKVEVISKTQSFKRGEDEAEKAEDP